MSDGIQEVALSGSQDLDELVKELDAILDAWFMSEVAPALEEASRARAAVASEAGLRVA